MSQIQEWFRQTVTYDNGLVQGLCEAFMGGDVDKIQNNLNMILIKTISGLDDACDRAMKQIRDRRYDEALREDGREDIIAYGIAFCRKRSKVVCEKM